MPAPDQATPSSLVELLRKNIIDAIGTATAPEKWRVVIADRPALKIVSSVLKMHSVLEQNVMAIESRVFLTTPSDQPFYALYSPHTLDTVGKDLDAAADRLLSVVVSLNIRPYIRYYKPSASAPYAAPQSLLLPGNGKTETLCPRVAESMAAIIQGKLNDYFSHEQSNPDGRGNYADTLDPSVIIVVDRSIDLYAPLLHEFTYQALVHDLIDLERGNKYVYDSETTDGQIQTVEAELSEQKDVIWQKCRHRHIGVVSQSLADQFEKLIKENAGVKATQQA
ncbi:syntaxin binding protein 1 [Coemansia sp. RSA 1821]|nr:syntaxin binding protein 1 [Coemansia sp. RSA 1821]KAJ2650351.1 syntaxin binding protein 1 [Coemansia sp. RSA 1250]